MTSRLVLTLAFCVAMWDATMMGGQPGHIRTRATTTTFTPGTAAASSSFLSIGRRGSREWRMLLPRLRGGGGGGGGTEGETEREAADREEYELEELEQNLGGDVRWEGAHGTIGFEDAMPHPDVTGWSPDEYTRRGWDMSGGLMDPVIANPEGWVQEVLDSIPRLTEEEEFEAAEKYKARAIARKFQDSDESDGAHSESEEEREKELKLEGVCPLCPDWVHERHRAALCDLHNSTSLSRHGDIDCRMVAIDRHPPPPENTTEDLATRPVDDMTLEDWEEMTEEQRDVRLETAIKAFEKGETSPLFDADYVYGQAKECETPEERHARLYMGIMGMHVIGPAAEKGMRLYDDMVPKGVNQSLMDAALDGDSQQCGFWVRRGADVNTIDGSTGYTPLMVAADAGHERAAKALLDAGADAFATENEEGRMAVHIAASAGWCGIVRIIVGAMGGQVDARSERRGRTPLHDAASAGQTHTVTTLLSMGADVRAIYKGLPAMPEEEEQELFDMRDCELEEARSHMQAPQRGARPPEEKGCIFDEKMAAREQFLPGKLWCERKYDTRLRAFANEGATALHDAAEGGFKRTCLVLLAAGASLHATDADGVTPRERAAGRGTVGDPQCPIYAPRGGGVLDVLDRWESGDLGPGDVPELPSGEALGPGGIRARVGFFCGREVRGEGGDIVGWDAPWNHNGQPPATVNAEWDDYEENAEEVCERDIAAHRARLQGVRRRGFWNPGHELNYASHGPSQRELLAAGMLSLCIPRRAKLTEEERQERTIRRWQYQMLPDQVDSHLRFCEEMDAKEKASGAGFFAQEMMEA